MTANLTDASAAFLGKEAIHDLWRDRYLNPDVEPIYELIFDRIAAALAPIRPGPVLDAGCGSCRHAARLVRRGFDVEGVDFSEAALAQARDWLAGAGLLQRISLRQASLLALPYEDRRFRGVISWGVLMHIPDLETAVGELCRVLAPGGRLVLGENNAASFDVRWFEPALMTVKRLLGRRIGDRRRTPFGIEEWLDHGDGGLMVRKSDIDALTGLCAENGLRLVERFGGQFTEAFASLPFRGLRRAVHRFNERRFRDQTAPDRFMGAVLVFERPAA